MFQFLTLRLQRRLGRNDCDRNRELRVLKFCPKILTLRLFDGADTSKGTSFAATSSASYVDGRLEAAVVALDVGDAYYRAGEDDAEPVNVLSTATKLRLEPWHAIDAGNFTPRGVTKICGRMKPRTSSTKFGMLDEFLTRIAPQAYVPPVNPPL